MKSSVRKIRSKLDQADTLFVPLSEKPEDLDFIAIQKDIKMGAAVLLPLTLLYFILTFIWLVVIANAL